MEEAMVEERDKKLRLREKPKLCVMIMTANMSPQALCLVSFSRKLLYSFPGTDTVCPGAIRTRKDHTIKLGSGHCMAKENSRAVTLLDNIYGSLCTN
ncbi:hypothetical protein VNO78_17791 [Psophocarpus tetragonolobus]|uniref:Uncharacterized protein n=1 Tax=Psophocarpus tetragonolobus TaxID=3891 RepID=A0AAN9XLH4_PSOTE